MGKKPRANRSTDRRIGLGLGDIPTSVRCMNRRRPTVTLAWGLDFAPIVPGRSGPS